MMFKKFRLSGAPVRREPRCVFSYYQTASVLRPSLIIDFVRGVERRIRPRDRVRHSDGVKQDISPTKLPPGDYVGKMISTARTDDRDRYDGDKLDYDLRQLRQPNVEEVTASEDGMWLSWLERQQGK